VLVLSAISIVLGVAIIVGWIVFMRSRMSHEAVPVPVPVSDAPQLRADVRADVRAADILDDISDDVSIVESVAAPPSWPQQVHRVNGALDDEARLRLMKDLGMLRAAWCVPILERAAEEESNPELHAAALAALVKCRRADATTVTNGRVRALVQEDAPQTPL
jgi:hypothetical protein